ncbi:MAG: hypothetical protein U1E63_08255 [Burkholderiales bacterium]
METAIDAEVKERCGRGRYYRHPVAHRGRSRPGEAGAVAFRARDDPRSDEGVSQAEWVLRRLYGLDVVRIVDALTALIALPNVRCEHLRTVTAALDWTGAGLDFADALHLAGGRAADHFITFDSKLVQRANRISDLQVDLV